MRIAIVTPEYPPKWGGIGTYVYNLAKVLSRFGHEISVFVRKEKFSRLESSSDGIHIYEVPWVYAPIVFSTSFGKNAIQKLQEIGTSFDVVYLQCPYASLDKDCFAKINAPVVSIMHGTWRGERNCLKLDQQLLRSPSDISMLLTSRFLEKYERLAMKKSAAVITISQYCAKELLSYGMRETEVSRKLTVIPNGVDTTLFRPASSTDEREKLRARYGIGPEDQMLLFVGRLVSRKGVDVLLHSLALTISKGSALNPKLVVVGTGPLEKRLKEQAMRLGIWGRVVFTTVSRDEDLIQHYAASDLFVFPSYYEGFGIVLLEAMACGLPVLASNASAIPELVIEGETGSLVNPGDSIALSEKLIYLLKHSDLRIEMGKAARTLALANYDWNTIAQRTAAVFESVSNTQK